MHPIAARGMEKSVLCGLKKKKALAFASITSKRLKASKDLGIWKVVSFLFCKKWVSFLT